VKQARIWIIALGAMLFSFSATHAAVTFDFAAVSDPGNLADTLTGRGAVSDPYFIAKHEVTNAQYCEFLNAIAGTDTNSLYNENMATGSGGILRAGSPGSYTYSVRSGRANKPVVFVSRYDAARFANWLHNGQPVGAQGPGTTESGAYSTPATNDGLVRSAGANYFVPDDDEWFKAAYFKAGSVNGYWNYATQSDTLPTSELPAGGLNSANFYHDDGVANGVNGGFALTQSTSFNPNSNYLADVGAYASSTSSYGTFDQSGSVWEWTEVAGQALRGGGWNGTGSNVGATTLPRSYNYFEFGITPAYERDHFGFRIAASTNVPEATSALLMFVGASLAGQRRSVRLNSRSQERSR
jgi:sulfatase modifying factor 1